MLAAYASVPRGDPLVAGTSQIVLVRGVQQLSMCVTPCCCDYAGTLLGPLHTRGAIKEYTDGLEEIKKQGGTILCGGKVVPGAGNFVEPTIVEIDPSAPIVKTELFVPILYIMKFKVWAFRGLFIVYGCMVVITCAYVFFAGTDV